MTPPTLQDIADKVGCARSTASLALRNHPALAEKTRLRIQKVAEEMGYRPNPLVAALMTQLRSQKKGYQETIAVLVKSSMIMQEIRNKSLFYYTLYAAIEERAHALGFKVDAFCLEEQNLSAERMKQILISRGIHGVLLFPGGGLNQNYMDFDWGHVAVVLIGFNQRYSNFNQVVSDYTHDIKLALNKLRERNVQNVGFLIPEARNRGCDYNWLSRFLLFQQELPRKYRHPILRTQGDDLVKEDTLAWIRKYKPEVLLIAGSEVRDWLEEEGYRIPEDIQLINLVKRGEPGLAGIDSRTPQVGMAGVELLVSLLQSSEFGLPELPRRIAIKGVWEPGDSFIED